MTSPLTTAARALVLAQSGVDCFDDLEPEAQESAREHVRAVLLAVREPSEKASDAGWETQQWMRDEGCLSFDQVTEVWQAMLDAALEEG